MNTEFHKNKYRSQFLKRGAEKKEAPCFWQHPCKPHFERDDEPKKERLSKQERFASIWSPHEPHPDWE